jgi:DNA gyrase/topoisomerase IV subunit B
MEYDESNIPILSSAAEAIRKRPAMYLGPLDDPLLLNRLLQESLCLAADEAMSGHCTAIRVHVEEDGTSTVRDDGRGLPMTPDETGRPLAERLLTELFACRAHKEDGRLAESCCQSGIVVVNALSEWLRLRNFRDGICWSQAYERGKPTGPFRPESPTTETGVELAFRPDSTILGPLRFDGRALVDWFAGLGLGFESVDAVAGEATGWPVTVSFEGIAPRHPAGG